MSTGLREEGREKEGVSAYPMHSFDLEEEKGGKEGERERGRTCQL